LRAPLVLQVFYLIRSEGLFVEQIDYNPMENRDGPIAAMVSHVDGFAERDAALLILMEKQQSRWRRITVGADKAHDSKDFVTTAREPNVTAHVTRNENGGAATSTAAPLGTQAMPSAGAADGWSKRALDG
jgi:hypothetical protein